VGLDGGGGGGLLDMFDLFVMFNTCRYRAGSCKLPVLWNCSLFKGHMQADVILYLYVFTVPS
jgi:hypothetical protein